MGLAALHIDWLRVGADLLAVFCAAWLGQAWGYRHGRKEERELWVPHPERYLDRLLERTLLTLPESTPAAHVRMIRAALQRGGYMVVPRPSVPDRQSERLPT